MSPDTAESALVHGVLIRDLFWRARLEILSFQVLYSLLKSLARLHTKATFHCLQNRYFLLPSQCDCPAPAHHPAAN